MQFYDVLLVHIDCVRSLGIHGDQTENVQHIVWAEQ